MIPPFLTPFDKIAIVSPSGNIDVKYIDGAVKCLTEWRLQPIVGEFARGQVGRFSGTVEQRISDLQTAIDDDNIKAIFCSRGGYGLIQIVDNLDFTAFDIHPKWIIGFSDITVLHNATSGIHVVSLHSVMAKHLTEFPHSEPARLVHDILFGQALPNYIGDRQPLDRNGKVEGKLLGGNLSVLFSLRGTHFDLDTYDKILFIEDIAEKPYYIDRMMQNLKMGGVLENLKGLIVGQFTEYEEDPSMGKTVYEIIADAVSEYDYPVCFNYPAGHVDNNIPLLLGAEVKLSVSNDKVELVYLVEE
ncbi:MAG: LD-carboxypeptidase [Paludibacteraceae bacterium]|nr:LD-carboxypeptidase [Paludibacteraceae bacterium]